ncbi:MAG: C25 family cysteine peptidase, partial [Acidobacteriota bacterium]
SLAEALMNAPNGGAVGVWASSGLTDSDVQHPMNKELLNQLFNSSQTIGEAVVKAKASESDPDVRKTWILFGDPTLKIVR